MADQESAPVSAEVPVAEQGGEVAPEETTEQEASGEEGEASTPEGEESEESEPEKEEAEPTAAQKRIQELANLRRDAENRAKALEQRLAEVEQRFSQNTLEQTVDENALNEHLGRLREEIEFMRIDGKHLAADLKEQERNNLIAEYQQWKKMDTERRSRAQVAQQTEQQRKASLAEFDKAAVFLAKEAGIPDAVFAKMGETFSEVVKTDRIFASQLLETLQYQGPIRAAQFAHEKIKSITAANEQAAAEEKAKRDAAKAVAVKPGVGASPQKSSGLSDDLPIDEWIKRRNAQLKR